MFLTKNQKFSLILSIPNLLNLSLTSQKLNFCKISLFNNFNTSIENLGEADDRVQILKFLTRESSEVSLVRLMLVPILNK